MQVHRSMRNREVFVTDMLEWLKGRLTLGESLVDADTLLFGSGRMRPLQVLDLAAYVETAIGAAIPDSRIRLDNFSSVNQIADVFLGANQ